MLGDVPINVFANLESYLIFLAVIDVGRYCSSGVLVHKGFLFVV